MKKIIKFVRWTKEQEKELKTWYGPLNRYWIRVFWDGVWVEVGYVSKWKVDKLYLSGGFHWRWDFYPPYCFYIDGYVNNNVPLDVVKAIITRQFMEELRHFGSALTEGAKEIKNEKVSYTAS